MPDLTPPLSAAPDQLDALFPKHPDTGQPEHVEELAGARAAMAAAYGQASAIIDLDAALAADSTLTAPARALRLSAAIEKAAAKATQRMRAGVEAMRVAVEAQERAISAPPVFGADALLLPEIRAGLRGMSEEVCRKALIEAMEAGDFVTVAAALKAPPAATGMSRDAQILVRHEYQRRLTPTALAHLHRLEKAHAVMTRGAEALEAFFAKVTDVEAVKRAQAAAGRTAAATAALNGA